MMNIDRKKLLDLGEPPADCAKTHSHSIGYALWSSHDRSDDAYLTMAGA